ncbi:hypothetical protein V1291_004921 [Nitrobacteraceae bacterium AZCC 1564]
MNSGQSSRLTELLAQAAALQKQQVSMSIKDYGLAKYGLEEQIATERLKAGEQLDTYKLQFEGQVFNLAGKMYGPDVLKGANLSDSIIPMTKPVTLDDNSLHSCPESEVLHRACSFTRKNFKSAETISEAAALRPFAGDLRISTTQQRPGSRTHRRLRMAPRP